MIGLLLREALDRLHVRLNMYLVIVLTFITYNKTIIVKQQASHPFQKIQNDVINNQEVTLFLITPTYNN